MAFDFGAGLAEAGKTAAQVGQQWLVDTKRAELEEQKVRLADELLGAREEKGRSFTKSEREATQTWQGGENEKTRQTTLEGHRISAGASLGAASISANAVPADVRAAEWLAKATPEQREAYRAQLAIKAGLPPWMAAEPSRKSPDESSVKVGKESDGSKGNAGGYDNIPPEAHGTVKAMIEGRLPLPTSFALAKPFWQNMMQLAQSVDPNFDATTWAARNATRKDFTAGQAAKGVTALNTALGHAGVLAENFSKLDNGSLPMWNAFVNSIGTQFGSDKVTNAKMAIDALASEARKVFAATGGGNLTELQEWQKNFPVNGSPEQQKGAMKQFVELLDSRLVSLANQYNRGMGQSKEPLQLLEPHARHVFEKLVGREPEDSTGYQTGSGKSTPTKGKTAGGDSATAASPLPPRQDRVIGRVYDTPTGRYTWMGNGWLPAPEPTQPKSLKLPPLDEGDR